MTEPNIEAFDQALDVLKDRKRKWKEPTTTARRTQDNNLAWRVRSGLGLTQRQFSERFGVPLTTVRNWEQGVSEPDAAARLLLQVIEAEPENVAKLAKKSELC